jgi:hypothetical protein
VTALAATGTNLFAGTVSGGVFLSTSNGTNWAEVNFGLADKDIRSLAVSKTTLFAGTFAGCVFKRPLSEMITTVSHLSTRVPKNISLNHNYPNPFNPTTNISYYLPLAAHVTLEVFNTTGERVAKLVNERKASGYHTVEFNASKLSSGMYLFCLQTGDFRQTKKMILAK